MTPVTATTACNLVHLKKEFVSVYRGSSQIQEVLPASTSDLFPIESRDLALLHKFAEENPIYYNSYEQVIGSTPCVVYEGDINRYWLNSIQHDSSHAPFSPTWILSAYLCAMSARELGYTELVDVGSGDGRTAFCASILGMTSHSIEIDDVLVDLQRRLCGIVDFHTYCSDSDRFDYLQLNLTHPVFFIGGLAQMGGTSLASAVLGQINPVPDLQKNSGWVFAGTVSKKYAADPRGEFGWGTLLEENGLKSVRTVMLPTAWTFDQLDDTSYVFAQPCRYSNQNKAKTD